MKLVSRIASLGSVALLCVACSAAPKADVAVTPANAPAPMDAPPPMPAPAAAEPTGQDALAAQAKISEAQAQQTALAKVPNGTIKASELENENALLIWSFDIARPDSKNITEIQVDAMTGKIVSNVVETPKDQAKEVTVDALEAQAKISEAQARQTALAKVPNGTIKASELENEHNLLIWSFDIARPDSKNITEIQVDAKTGKIVSNEIETPKDQAKEAATDAQQKP